MIRAMTGSQTSEPHPTLDPLDRTIVEALRRDGRQSIPALAEAVGTSRATAYARFNRLCERGVITGFEATVDPAALGMTVTALLMVTARQAEWPDLRQQLAVLPGVEWVGLTTGPYDFVVLVRSPDLAHLRDVVLGELQALAAVRSTQTLVILDEQAAG